MATDLSGLVNKVSEDLGKAGVEKTAKPDDIAAFQDAYRNNTDTSNRANNPFLDFIAKARTDFDGKMEQISSLSDGKVSPAGLIKVQYAISSMMVTQDLMAKAVGKANQTLETLLKMQ